MVSKAIETMVNGIKMMGDERLSEIDLRSRDKCLLPVHEFAQLIHGYGDPRFFLHNDWEGLGEHLDGDRGASQGNQDAGGPPSP